MKIVDFTVTEDEGILLKLKATKKEYKQLKGDICNLCMFSADAVSQSVKAIKTGARHNMAKWLLLPVCIRSKYKCIDYDKVQCACLEQGDRVFFIYAARRK